VRRCVWRSAHTFVCGAQCIVRTACLNRDDFPLPLLAAVKKNIKPFFEKEIHHSRGNYNLKPAAGPSATIGKNRNVLCELAWDNRSLSSMKSWLPLLYLFGFVGNFGISRACTGGVLTYWGSSACSRADCGCCDYGYSWSQTYCTEPFCCKCDPGHYESGMSDCIPCPPGTMNSVSAFDLQISGISACTSCLAGKFSGTGATVCTTCPSGTTSLSGAARA
jgi:hypothetical protein